MFTHTHARRIAAALGACALTLPLHAQQRTADDPQAAVPPTRYQPAWEPPAAPPDSATPDRNWRALNRTVAENAAADPHAGHGHHAHHAAPAERKAPQPDPHAGHHGHAVQPAAKDQHQHHGEHH